LRRHGCVERHHSPRWRGTCSLTGKEGDGLAITFDDGTVKNQFLSWKAFRQLLAMKMTTPKPESKIPLALAADSHEAATM
jgi:hypothetical protein